MTAKCLSALLLPAALSPRLCPACLLVLDVVPCSWTCWSLGTGSTWIWWPGAWDPSARRATGLAGACAGCWWVGRREMGRFQLHPGRGAKNAKKGESESKKEQKMMHAQRATLIQVGSCRVTNALLLLLAQALHFLLQEALALLLLGVLGAPPRVQLKTPHFAASYPPAAGARSQQPRSSPCRWIPCPGLPEKRASHLHRQVGPGEL